MHENLRVQAEAIERIEDDNMFFDIFNRFVGFHTQEASRESINDTTCEYPFVAMDTRQVFAQIHCVWKYLAESSGTRESKHHTFLDIGCGIGNVLLIAEQFRFDVFGIEKDDYPFRIATRLIGADRILQKDIRIYEEYGNYDVIYYFRPFAEREQQRFFEKHVEDRMKIGGILIANHKNSDAISADPRFRKISDMQPIWEKVER